MGDHIRLRPLSSSLEKKERGREGKKRRGKKKDDRKEVKRRRGQQLASAGLELTLSFYKGSKETWRGEKIGELKECSGLLYPPRPLPLTPPLISPPAKQGSKGGREGGVGDKTPDVPSFDGALPCQCILAFLPSCLGFCLPKFRCSTFHSNKQRNKLSVYRAQRLTRSLLIISQIGNFSKAAYRV